MDPSSSTTRMDPQRERALVARSRLDASAFGELVDFHLPRIHAFVLLRVRERTVAEDVTWRTFERGLVNVRRVEFRNESFGGWL
jgi:RNA polymerase sigma-70 factor (ECF subfamily)